MFRGHLLCRVAFWYSHVYDSTFVIGMNEFVSSSPFPVSCVLLRSSSVHPAHQTGDGDPEEEGDEDYCTHNIVLEKLENCTDADIVNEIPDSNNVLVSFLTMAFVTKSLEARCPVRKDVYRGHSITGTIQISSTTTLTSIGTAITHTGLFSLGFAEWNAFSLLTFSFLYTVGPVSHMVRFGAVSTHSGTLRLLLTGSVVCCPALGVDRHVLAVVAARGVLVAADAVVPQLAVLITAGVPVF